MPSGGVCWELAWQRDRLQQGFLRTASSTTAQIPTQSFLGLPTHQTLEAEKAEDARSWDALSQLWSLHSLPSNHPEHPWGGTWLCTSPPWSLAPQISFHPSSSRNKSPNICQISFQITALLSKGLRGSSGIKLVAPLANTDQRPSDSVHRGKHLALLAFPMK